MAESKRRGEDAVDERLDEGLDGDALRDDAVDERLDKPVSRSKRATAVDKSTRAPAKRKAAARPGVFARIRNFIREIISELTKVIWPTRKELLTYTAVVVVFVAIIMTIVGGLDSAFAYGVLHVFGAGKGK